MDTITVKEIEKAVSGLDRRDLDEFAEWFDEHRASLWDEQIEQDSRVGRFDSLISEAKAEYDAGRTRPL